MTVGVRNNSQPATVVKLANTRDLKSLGEILARSNRVGSTTTDKIFCVLSVIFAERLMPKLQREAQVTFVTYEAHHFISAPKLIGKGGVYCVWAWLYCRFSYRRNFSCSYLLQLCG